MATKKSKSGRSPLPTDAHSVAPGASRPAIFVNYRWADCGSDAQWLAEDLQRVFGKDAVFFDKRTIKPGEPWPDTIRDALDGSRIVLACIGEQWHLVRDEDTGMPRLDAPGDWVHDELVRANETQKSVVPVLLAGRTELPRKAIEVRPPLAFLNDRKPVVLRLGSERDPAIKELRDAIVACGVALLPDDQQVRPQPGDLMTRYLEHVRQAHAHLMPFFPELRDRLLASVFVQVELARVDKERGGDSDRAVLESHRWGAAGPLESFVWPTKDAPDATDTGDSPARPARLAITGEPGAGKSTLARNLAHTLATRDDEVRVPVYVALGRLSVGTFDPFLVAAEEALPGSSQAPQLAALLRAKAAAGRAVVLLDGLDEIDGERVDCGVAARTIEALATNLKCPLVVLTRPLALRGTGLARHLLRTEVQPLGLWERDQLVAKLLEGDAPRFLSLLAEKGSLADLCRNPLLLTMAALVARDAFVQDQPVPTRRGAIYDRAIDLLLQRGHVAGGHGVRDWEVARKILARLSLILHEQGGELWSPTVVSDALWQVRKDNELDFRVRKTWASAGAQHEAEQRVLLADLGTNAGVLGPFEVQTSEWRYLHRSLREYLVAERLAELGSANWKPRIEAWAKQSKSMEGEERAPTKWAEVFALLVGCVKTGRPLDVLVAIRAVSSALARRALSNADGLSPADGLAFALADPEVDGDLLLALCRAWLVPAAVAESILMAHVTPETPIDRLGGIWYVLESMGRRPARAGFFAKCGRGVEDAPRLKAVAVPAGRFTMGSPAPQMQQGNDEPSHEVSVPAFWLCTTVVTSADFARFEQWHTGEKWKGQNPGDLSMHPVIDVSWWAANLYCRWLGDDVRLPSEAEWEYACRAGTTTWFSFGANITSAQVNYNGNYPFAGEAEGKYRERTVPVGSLPANAWGLHEMHGNVWEWCEDWYGDYSKSPVDGSAQQENHGSGQRVLRGGSWFASARSCRSASRAAYDPSIRRNYVGFRPVSSSPDSFTTLPPQQE